MGHAMDGLVLGGLYVPPRAIGLLSFITLCATLIAGLWPFCSPENQVTWITGENGIRFGDHGTVLSAGTLESDAFAGPACTVEFWIKPAQTWATGSLLDFYNSQNDHQFAIEQDSTDLVLHVRSERRNGWNDQKEWRAKNVFRKKQALITVTSDGQNTFLYIDGQLTTTAPKFDFSSKDLAGQLIIANSPFRKQSWSGIVKGLAIYGRELNAAQVLGHYRDWTQQGEPTLASLRTPFPYTCSVSTAGASFIALCHRESTWRFQSGSGLKINCFSSLP